jgi:hypothetical protein
LKQPSDTEVASAKSAKLSKKIVPCAIAAATAVRATLGTSDLERHEWTSGLKSLGAPGDLRLQLVRRKLSRPSKNVAFPPRYGGGVFD